ARQMRAHNQTVFYLEHLQPDWLPLGRLRQIYEALAVKFVGILIGALVGLLIYVGFFSTVIAPSSFIIRSGLVGGLVGGLISGSPFTTFRLTVVAKAWTRRWRHLCFLGISNGVLLAIATWI